MLHCLRLNLFKSLPIVLALCWAPSALSMVLGLGVGNKAASFYLSNNSGFDRDNHYFAQFMYTPSGAYSISGGIRTGNFAPSIDSNMFYNFSVFASTTSFKKSDEKDQKSPYLGKTERPDGLEHKGLGLGLELGYQFNTDNPSAATFALAVSPDPINQGLVENYLTYQLEYKISMTPSVLINMSYLGDLATFNKKVLYRGKYSKNQSANHTLLFGIRLLF